MPVYRDQLKREIELPAVPTRIISVVPSQTELLFDLGLDREIIGITKFCIHPAGKVKHVQKTGGTKQLDIEKIRSLQPDLIIANKEENERAQIEALMNVCPVWISDISNLDEALEMIDRVGAVTGKAGEAKALVTTISQQFDKLSIKPSNKKVAYFIWRKPWMVAGKGTFIDDMLQKCGFCNVFEAERYPEVDAQAIADARPDMIFLSSEPYPFKEKHIEEIHEILPSATIKLVDGEMFSWYGSRLVHAPAYFKQLITELSDFGTS